MPPPKKLILTLAGEAKEYQSSRGGTYILSDDDPVNGYPYWLKKTDESQAIWYDIVYPSWTIGPKEVLGTSTGGIFGPKGIDAYPNEIKRGWRFSDNDGVWDAGPNDVIFKVLGAL